ncbi:hypothetical protein GF377_05060 [candidate division GN15 bacterium]|nr:hypothetical protein [candidate division GN15 bacterium]
MAVRIGRFDFEGPFETTDELDFKPGVWAIISLYHGRASIAGVGQAAEVKPAVESARNDLAATIDQSDKGRVLYAAYYTPPSAKDDQREIEREIRTQFDIAQSHLTN